MMNQTQESRWGRDLFALALRLVLAAIFFYSAWHKIGDPISFQMKVSEYKILPTEWEETFAHVLPWAMAACSALLVLGLLTRVGAAGLGMMLLSFIIAISVNIYKDRVLGCGCFSEQGHEIGPLLLVQDASLLLFALYLVIRGGGEWGLDRFLPGPGRLVNLFRSINE